MGMKKERFPGQGKEELLQPCTLGPQLSGARHLPLAPSAEASGQPDQEIMMPSALEVPGQLVAPEGSSRGTESESAFQGPSS